ncbi:UNVERIFIED_CONTAM: hypothetical protein PYX00_001022 [Menopon gallinae]
MIVDSSLEYLLLGTEGGNVYYLKLKTFKMSMSIIYLDVILQNMMGKYKVTNPGAVEALAEQPGKPNHILLGYTKGLMVLWDRSQRVPKQIFLNNQQVECLCWDSLGHRFISSHNDGSYAFWDVEKPDKPIEEPTTLYGPFPCKPVTKLIWKQIGQEDLIILAGGMPRASYSEKYTVTVYGNNGKTHVVLDFTSKVIDFTYIESETEDELGILLVLAEEELVAVDLSSDDMKMISLPYLASLHASAVTCSYHASGVRDILYELLKEAGQLQIKDMYSNKEWPTLGGTVLSEESDDHHEVLLTGHEDGTVRFWDCSGVTLSPLYKFSTAPLFATDMPASPSEDEEEWPPFKKIGTFDPYSDDPRLAVRRVWLCPESGTLIVAGAAGHVIVVTVGSDTESQIPIRTMNIVSDRDNFVWKGHEALVPNKEAPSVQQPGFQVSSILQIHPPVGITALCCSTDLGLIGVGTAHGLVLYDYVRMKPVIAKCTLNPNDISGAGDAPISRRKSFKKSLRESFRRLRRGRSTRGAGGDKRGVTSPGSQSVGPVAETRPVERQIEARPVDDSLGSMVRCVHIATTFLVSPQHAIPTFWVGTNNGTVYAFTISLPPRDKRKDADVSSHLGKEIQLKHRAPVLSVTVVDANGLPVHEHSVPPHRVLICSEEQFKIFTLPSLKPMCKLKLTAHEGCRVRKTSFAKFVTADNRTTETCLLCLTNLGECFVLSVPELRRQLNSAVIPSEDINGITSLTFTTEGEAFYLHSSSEFQRITLSATKVTALNCKVDLPESCQWAWQNNDDDSTSEAESDEEVNEESPAEDSKMKESEEAEEEEDEKSEEKEGSDEGPMVNGSLGSTGKPLENGLYDERHELSVGDITVDSVKDHIINSNHSLNDISHDETKTTVKTTTTIITESNVTPAN